MSAALIGQDGVCRVCVRSDGAGFGDTQGAAYARVTKRRRVAQKALNTAIGGKRPFEIPSAKAQIIGAAPPLHQGVPPDALFP
jgi:hypothetical protein